MCHHLFYVLYFRTHCSIPLDDYLSRVTVKNEEEYYLDKLQRLSGAFPHVGAPHEPTKICNGVYLGSTANAEDTRLMRRLGITHVINCSAPRKMIIKDNHPFDGRETGIVGYMSIDTRDDENYEMRAHFVPVCDYIKRVRHFGGSVFICCPGTSASASIAIAYLMLVKNMYLLEAAKKVKDLRRTSVCNVSYMKQLVEFATDNCLPRP